MGTEYDALVRNHTWELIEKELIDNLIYSLWVLGLNIWKMD